MLQTDGRESKSVESDWFSIKAYPKLFPIKIWDLDRQAKKKYECISIQCENAYSGERLEGCDVWKVKGVRSQRNWNYLFRNYQRRETNCWALSKSWYWIDLSFFYCWPSWNIRIILPSFESNIPCNLRYKSSFKKNSIQTQRTQSRFIISILGMF